MSNISGLDSALPKDPCVRIVGLKNAVHDTPVKTCAYTVERNSQALSQCTRCPVTSHQELGSNHFSLSSPLVADCRPNRMAWKPVVVDTVVLKQAAPLNETAVSSEISDVDAFDLALRDNVETSVSRV